METPVIRRARERQDQTSVMAAEIRKGLLATPPWLPSKYFYDDRGSRLFEAITQLPEYYQTRTEEGILERDADAIVALAQPTELTELGSGSSRKIRLLLNAMARRGLLRRCVLLDINESVLDESVGRLQDEYPGLEASGVVGDFARDLEALGAGGGRMAILLAGTVGNLHPDAELPGFLRALTRQLEPNDFFLVGLDLVKDEARLEAAYNDSAGVTAQFNLNILQVINDRLGANFDLGAFEHVAFYDREQERIEMRLRAKRETHVTVPVADLEVRYRAGDEIRTEISCKYTRASWERRVSGTRMRLEGWFSDPEELFAVALLRRT